MPTPMPDSVQMAFTLLNAIHGANKWISCEELSRSSNYSETSTYRMIRILKEIGAVLGDSRGRYRLNPCFTFLPKVGTATEAAANRDNIVDLAMARSSRSAYFLT